MTELSRILLIVSGVAIVLALIGLERGWHMPRWLTSIPAWLVTLGAIGLGIVLGLSVPR